MSLTIRSLHKSDTGQLIALCHARQQGWQLAATRSANPAMIRVNEKLGFRRGRAEVRLVKRLVANNLT